MGELCVNREVCCCSHIKWNALVWCSALLAIQARGGSGGLGSGVCKYDNKNNM